MQFANDIKVVKEATSLFATTDETVNIKQMPVEDYYHFLKETTSST